MTNFPNGIALADTSVTSTAANLAQITLSVPIAAAATVATETTIFAVNGSWTLIPGKVCFRVAPACSLSTVLFALENYDLSTTTDDNLLSTATIDVETLTDKQSTDLTLTATGADLVLVDGDSVFATVTSNNADMADGTGGIVTLVFQRT